MTNHESVRFLCINWITVIESDLKMQFPRGHGGFRVTETELWFPTYHINSYLQSDSEYSEYWIHSSLICIVFSMYSNMHISALHLPIQTLPPRHNKVIWRLSFCFISKQCHYGLAPKEWMQIWHKMTFTSTQVPNHTSPCTHPTSIKTRLNDVTANSSFLPCACTGLYAVPSSNPLQCPLYWIVSP